MENISGRTARNLKHIGLLLCGVVLWLALAPRDMLTRDGEEHGAFDSAGGGYYEGVVVLPDPSNFWTGVEITDEKCFVRVRRHEPGVLSVESSFSEEPVLVHAGNLSGQDFYMGRFGDEQALVLQLQPPHEVAALTHTSFDSKGVLNYGVEGDGDFTRECMI